MVLTSRIEKADRAGEAGRASQAGWAGQAGEVGRTWLTRPALPAQLPLQPCWPYKPWPALSAWSAQLAWPALPAKEVLWIYIWCILLSSIWYLSLLVIERANLSRCATPSCVMTPISEMIPIRTGHQCPYSANQYSDWEIYLCVTQSI